MDLLDPEALKNLASDALSHQVTQFGIAFTLAALAHAKQVRKEIRIQFESVTIAINNVARKLGDDLEAQAKITGELKNDVSGLKFEVSHIKNRLSLVDKGD